MILTLSFVLIFLTGPLGFWMLARRGPSGAHVTRLLSALLLLFLTALAIDSFAPGSGSATGLWVLALMWLAWVVLLSLCVVAIKARRPGGAVVRASCALAAMATTLPWFGLFAAQMVVRI